MSLPHSFLSGKGGRVVGGDEGGIDVMQMNALTSDGNASTGGSITGANFAADTYGERTFYHGNHATTDTDENNFILYTVPGKQFYIGLIGAGSGSSTGNNIPGSHGGAGVALITVPSGVTQMGVFMGGAGSTGSPISGGIRGGGASGSSGSSYISGASGGGIVGLFQLNHTQNPSTGDLHASAIVIVGSAGGAGDYSYDVGFENGGGKIGGNGSRAVSNGEALIAQSAGYGGTTIGGGARGHRANSSYTPFAHTSGSMLTGGRGDDSTYDAGSGGGAGYYGGGGGSGGGGYSGGNGGGGSGYIDASIGYVVDGSAGALPFNVNGNALPSSDFVQTQVRLLSGSNDYTAPHSSYGVGGSPGNHGQSGWIVVWNAG